MIALSVKNVSKSFKIPHYKQTSFTEFLTHLFVPVRADTLEVIKDISFTINTGETVGIIGSNGAGKSTLLKILASIYLPDSGKVTANGRVVPFLELGVGFNLELTGRENVFLNGIILGMKRSYLEKKFDEIVAFAELERFIDLPLKNYSSGMQVRLAFAIAFKSEADIYLLDEVFAVGDIAFQEKSRAVFADLKKRGKTLILVSHSPAVVKSFCERILYLNHGKIESFNSVDEGFSKYQQSVEHVNHG
jgi:ABC-2 type transport system ATP-binding protein